MMTSKRENLDAGCFLSPSALFLSECESSANLPAAFRTGFTLGGWGAAGTNRLAGAPPEPTHGGGGREPIGWQGRAGTLNRLAVLDSSVVWRVRRRSAGVPKFHRQGAERFRLRASNQGKRAGAGN